jgi:hypothetical protein
MSQLVYSTFGQPGFSKPITENVYRPSDEVSVLVHLLDKQQTQ